MEITSTKTALITGGSRGVGAATALALAERGYDIAITYRNKAARANDVVSQLSSYHVRTLAERCDMTKQEDVAAFFAIFQNWTNSLDLLVLNASGGLEREALVLDPDYPMHINHDAQLVFLDKALPMMCAGGVVIFVTSHWAHLYGNCEQVPAYGPVAESKYAGEQALRARMPQLEARAIRLLVVTGDLLDGTITPKLLERNAPGLIGQRRTETGNLPSATDMGRAIALAATDSTLPNGHTSVVGNALETLTLQ